MVQVIYTVQVHVLLVPPEHSLPAADIYVWVRHTWNLLIAKSLIQYSFQLAQIPWYT